ncbi:hypothetical protein M5K25_019020 [Dendrobium thyrsiflorum]|uniref:Protein N-terminal glutamine amidohydrolase n=1 Tax=Dendrobium thyrsiflorum TaxID=117978 RepID=A0ABD0UDR7_DENTH
MEPQIPLWNQKASKSSDKLVIWDYHVICIQIVNQKNTEEGRFSHLIWDLDSSLPFPLPLDQYISETFRLHLPLKSTYKRVLRVIHAPIFLQHFSSNRTHMRDPHGNWIAPPPNYEPIIAQDGSENNLDEYVRIRAADAMTDINALVDGLYSNKYGVLEGEEEMQVVAIDAYVQFKWSYKSFCTPMIPPSVHMIHDASKHMRDQQVEISVEVKL